MRGVAFHSTLEAVVINTTALLFTLVLFGIFIWIYGVDPFSLYHTLYIGAFARQISIETTLTQAAPLMLTALCTAIPARAGLLVIGGEGALVIGGVATVLVGVNLSGLPPWLGVIVLGLTGVLAGGVWVRAVGAPRQYRGGNEIIATRYRIKNRITSQIRCDLVCGVVMA